MGKGKSSKLSENLKVRIKQLTHNSIVVLTIGSAEALKPAQSLANSLTAYAKEHGIVNFNVVLTTPQVGVSALDEEMMRSFGWVRGARPEIGIGQRMLSAAESPLAFVPAPQPAGHAATNALVGPSPLETAFTAHRTLNDGHASRGFAPPQPYENS